MRSFKLLLLAGGAVLLLYGCANPTAPRRHSEDCRSGYYVRIGDKDVCAE